MKKAMFSLGVVLVLVALAGCASSPSASGGDLTGQVWALTDLAGKAPLPDTGITIRFRTDGTVSGSSGCNQYSGTYTVSGSSLTINTPLASTMMMCAEPVMAQEALYLKAMEGVKAYTVQGDTLTLFGPDDKAIATYKATSQDLAGTAWDVIGYNNGKQAVTSAMAGTQMDCRSMSWTHARRGPPGPNMDSEVGRGPALCGARPRHRCHRRLAVEWIRLGNVGFTRVPSRQLVVHRPWYR